MEESTQRVRNSFSVVLSGIIFNPQKKQILIIRNQDEKERWSFPRGMLNARIKIEDFLKKIFRKNLGYNIEVLGPVFSNMIPEEKNTIQIHYLCEIVGEPERIENTAELKWINPQELSKYVVGFSESALEEYLNELV